MTIWNDEHLREIAANPTASSTEEKLARYLLEQREISRELGVRLGASVVLERPVKARKSERYLVILEDANGIEHYWLPSGQYDGHGRAHKVAKA